MIAIDQTPDTNSESRRLADNLLARAADVFCANGQRIYRRADRTRKITYDDKDQMQELIDLYLVETAPMLDGLGEAIQTSSSGEVARITRELVGSSLYSVYPTVGRIGTTRPRRRPPGAHALLTDIRQRVPLVRSAFTQPVQTLPTSNS
jgi:hypothetical protein